MEEISDIKRDFNISKMCRTCLMETEDDMHEIFTNPPEPDALSLNQVLQQVSANIQVNSGGNQWQFSALKQPSPLWRSIFVPNNNCQLFNRFRLTTDFPTSSVRNARRKPFWHTTSKPPSSRATQRCAVSCLRTTPT